MYNSYIYLKHNQFSEKNCGVFSDGATRDAMARSMRLGAWDLMLNFKFIARNNPEIVDL
jgi:hypothetical protein